MNYLVPALHAALDAKVGVATAMSDDEARHRAYACRVASGKYAKAGAPGLALRFARYAYGARRAVHR